MAAESHSLLAHLVLSGADGEHRDRDAVELVKAAPCPCLSQALVDLTHSFIVHLVAAVEHIALHPQRPGQVLGSLCLPCPCDIQRACREHGREVV